MASRGQPSSRQSSPAGSTTCSESISPNGCPDASSTRLGCTECSMLANEMRRHCKRTGSTSMSIVRLLPAWFHAIADYAVGALLIIVAIAVGGSSGAVATGIVVGAVVLVVSMMTKYPLGVVKVLPFTIHSAGDYLAAALLVAAPWALNFADGDGGLAAFYVVMGLAVLAVSLITNYQYSPKRDWTPSTAQAKTA